jgi:DNA invertase Pin-like site-specific DNA recombinase
MARKSRKNIIQEVAEVQAPTIRAALYIRLSVQDTHTKSISIETQQLILNHYLESQPEIFVYDTYIDNGATGTNFHRPGFQQMLSDIEAGQVNCVIVKDLSRLGRNSIDAGYYIEQYFPQHKVRFIAVTDQYDSDNPDDVHAGIILPLKNMINEAYALDIGRKIKAQQRQAMKDGEYVGARPLYGYLKAPDNCHQLVIDPVTAPVVRDMFTWAAEGAGLNTIAVRLNEAKILSPSHYKKSIGLITNQNLLGNGKWQTRTVAVILRCQTYTGDLVQGHTKIIDHRQVQAGEDNLIAVCDTHEAIISHELFDKVQAILDKTAAEAKSRQIKPYTPNPLKGKIFCAQCGKALHRQRNLRKKMDDVYFFHCLTPSRVAHDDTLCKGITIREDDLISTITETMRREMGAKMKVCLQQQSADEELSEKQLALSAAKKEHELEIQNLRGRIRGLYEDLVQGLIDKEDYFQFKSQYEEKISAHEAEIEVLEKAVKEMEQSSKRRRRLLKDAETLAQEPEMAQKMIDRLVERVEVTHDKEVHITFCFQGTEE